MKRTLIAAAFVAGCGGNVSPQKADGGAPITDASMPDDQAMDDADDADVDPYHDLTNAKFWTSVRLDAVLGPNDFSAWSSGCFDGRYIYWGVYSWQGNELGAFVRYDTQKPFEDPASWTKWITDYWYFPSAPALFDGRYMFFGWREPSELRFDTTMTFGDPMSLSFSTGYVGDLVGTNAWLSTPTSDGRFAYISSAHGPMVANPSQVLRWDMQSSFVNREGWTLFDPHLAATGPAIFADPYLVLTPLMAGDAVLYDTRLPFASASSWSKLTLGGLLGQQWYVGPATDGRWIYYVPNFRTDTPSPSASGLVARRDTLAPLSPMQTFDLAKVRPDATAFNEASWDGRHVYFMTGGQWTMSGKPQTQTAIVARYDTRFDFQSKASWASFDMTPLAPAARPLAVRGGVVFDGQYIYIPGAAGPEPTGTPFVMRFDARAPRKMPVGFSGTFF